MMTYLTEQRLNYLKSITAYLRKSKQKLLLYLDFCVYVSYT